MQRMQFVALTCCQWMTNVHDFYLHKYVYKIVNEPLSLLTIGMPLSFSLSHGFSRHLNNG